MNSAVAVASGTQATWARVTTDAEFSRRPVPARPAPQRTRPSQLPIGASIGGAIGQSAAGIRPSQVPVASFGVSAAAGQPSGRNPLASSPDASAERVADELGDAAFAMSDHVPAGSTRIAVQRICTECEDEEKKQVQGKSAPSRAAASMNVPPEASPVLDVVGKGGGQPLAPKVRADMEARLGAGFSDVRIHTDAKAAESAAAVSAEAYTVGSEVVFGRGSFAPDSLEGQHRLAHELAHVLQQRKGPVSGTDTGSGVAVSDPSDCFEQEAQATATQVTPPQPVLNVQRCGDVARDCDQQRQGEEGVQRQTSARSVVVQRDDNGNGDGGRTQDQAAPSAAPGIPAPAPAPTPTPTTGSATKCNVDNFWMRFDDWNISWPWGISWPWDFNTTTIRLPVHFRVDLSAGCTKADCFIWQRKMGRTSKPGGSFDEWSSWDPDPWGHPWWNGSNWSGARGSWDWFGKDGADFEDEAGFRDVPSYWYPLYWGGVGGTGSFQFQTYVIDKATGADVDWINWEMLIDYPAPKTGKHSHS